MIDGAQSAREEIVDTGRKMWSRGFLAGTDGNISARLADGRILITPSGVPKGELKPDQLVLISPDGIPEKGPNRASSESKMHLFAYRSRSNIGACVHSHPPYCTAFAAAGVELPENILPETVLFVGRICLAEYAPPGTEAVPESLAPFIAEHSAFLLRNHGLLTVGRTLQEAYWRHETVEHFAQIYFLARQLGQPSPIPSEDFSRLSEMRESRNKSNALKNGKS